jgi:hypothetical protein
MAKRAKISKPSTYPDRRGTDCRLAANLQERIGDFYNARNQRGETLCGAFHSSGKQKRGSGIRQHLVLRAHEAENLAGDFFHKVVVGFLGREECNVALKLGAHGFEAFDLKL